MENQQLINFLNQLLANCFVMYVKLHRYHWYIQGRHFFQLHEKFAEMYESFAMDVDEIAERILMIDGKPLATMSKFLKESTLDEANADDKENEMIQQLIRDYEQIIQEMRSEGIQLATEKGDDPTSDLISSMQGKLEKYVWMLKASIAYE